jgi:zinc D-Ala-D-Ala dipeptidase
MQRPAAEALVRVQRALASEGYALLVYDAYRPWYITKLFWDATPVAQHRFVADPAQGSRHNRGCAVDLTLYDLKGRHELEMPSLYDEQSERAYPGYAGGSAEARRLRDLLRRHMEAEGFTVYEFEWWHFDYRDWNSYAIQNVRFEDIRTARISGKPPPQPWGWRFTAEKIAADCLYSVWCFSARRRLPCHARPPRSARAAAL